LSSQHSLKALLPVVFVQPKTKNEMIQAKELIVTDLSRKGNGKDVTSPIRTVLEVYTKDGELLAYRGCQGNYSVEDLVSFSSFCLSNKELSISEALQKWKTN
jgi:hypothetical protein